MSALEIVMISVVSILIILIALYIFIMSYLKKFRANKANDFLFINQHQPKGGTVFLGDSLTDFFPLADFFPDKSLCERGIASDKTIDVEKRINGIIELEPKSIFIQIGINDMIRKKRKLTPEILSDRIINIAKSFKTISENIYLISLYPVNRKKMIFSRFVCRHANNKRIVKVNELLEIKAKENNFQYIDIFSHLIDVDNQLRKEYTIEGLHLTIQGYEAISQVLKDYL